MAGQISYQATSGSNDGPAGAVVSGMNVDSLNGCRNGFDLEG